LRNKIAILCLLVLVVVATPGNARADSWSITTSPDFAFIGDNVSVELSGYPGVGAFVQMRSPDGSMIDERYVTTDGFGHAGWNYSIPADTPSGIYELVVVFEGENVTAGSLEIVFDEVLYQRFLIEELQEKLDFLGERVEVVKDLAVDNQAKVDTAFWVGLMGGVFSGTCLVIVLISLPMVYLFVWGKERDKEGIKRRLLSLRPWAKGKMDPYIEWVGGNLEKTKARKRAERAGVRSDLPPTAVIPSESSPQGFEAVALDAVDMDQLRKERRESIQHHAERLLQERDEKTGRRLGLLRRRRK